MLGTKMDPGPMLPDKETEAQRNEAACRRLHSRQRESQSVNPALSPKTGPFQFLSSRAQTRIQASRSPCGALPQQLLSDNVRRSPSSS